MPIRINMTIVARPLLVFAFALALLGAFTPVAGADVPLPDEQPVSLNGPSTIDGLDGENGPGIFDPDDPVGGTFASQAAGDVVTISGAGYGHGVGMSQWGAYGQASEGRNHEEILDFYYGGAAQDATLELYDAVAPGHDNLFVNLEYDRTDLLLRVLNTGSTNTGGATVTRGAETIDLTHGQTVQIVWLAKNQCELNFRTSTDLAEIPFAAWAADPCDANITWDGVSESPSTKIEITGCTLRDWDAAVDRACQYGRGAALHTIDNESPQRTSSGMDAGYDGFDLVLEIDVDAYTLGISEVSYTWPDAALQAQAVAARSYAAAAAESGSWLDRKCACDVYDTSRSQRYVGWGHTGYNYGDGSFSQDNWISASKATDNFVLTHATAPAKGIVSAVYSAANGGASENNEDIWGGSPASYLRSNPDSYDLVKDTGWTRSVPVDYFAGKVGLDVVTSAAIVARYISGSPSDIEISGRVAGVEKTKHYTATQFMALFSGTSYWLRAPRILSVVVPPPPGATVEVDRLWGSDRYATAAAISQDDYAAGSDKVFIATGQNYPDALAVTPLAHNLDGPVLLTRKGDLPSTTAAEVQRLGAHNIYILGGTAAVSSSVETALAALGTVTRIWGHDRYATAVEISKEAFPGGAGVAYVAVGTNFPDALAGAPVAAGDDGPLLLTHGNTLTNTTRVEINRLQPDTIVVLGGGTSVGQAVVNQLKALAASVVSLAGSDRYATAAKTSQYGFPSSAGTVYVARGTLYPDALAGGPAAANAPGPVLLTPENSLSSSAANELVRLRPSRVVILGGTAAVSSTVETAISDLLNN